MVLLKQLVCWLLSIGQLKFVSAGGDPDILHSVKDEYGDDSVLIKKSGFVNCSYNKGQPETYKMTSDEGRSCHGIGMHQIPDYESCKTQADVSLANCGTDGICNKFKMCQSSKLNDGKIDRPKCRPYFSTIKLYDGNINISVGETVLRPSRSSLMLNPKVQGKTPSTLKLSILSPSAMGSRASLSKHTKYNTGYIFISRDLPLQDAPYKVVVESKANDPAFRHWFYLRLFDSNKIRAVATFDRERQPICRFSTLNDKTTKAFKYEKYEARGTNSDIYAVCTMTVTVQVCFPHAHYISTTIEDQVTHPDFERLEYDQFTVQIYLYFIPIRNGPPVSLPSTSQEKLEEACIVTFPIDQEPCMKENHCNCQFNIIERDHVVLSFSVLKDEVYGDPHGNIGPSHRGSSIIENDIVRRVQSHFERRDSNQYELELSDNTSVTIYGGRYSQENENIKSEITINIEPKLSNDVINLNTLTESSKKLLNEQCSNSIKKDAQENPCRNGIEYCECQFQSITQDSVIAINLLVKGISGESLRHYRPHFKKLVQGALVNITLDLAQGGAIQVADPDQSSVSKLTMFKTAMKLEIIGNSPGKVRLYNKSIELLKAELKSALSTESDWCNEDCYFRLGTIKRADDPSIETTIFYTREVPVPSSQEIDDIKIDVSRIVAAKKLNLMGIDSSNTAVTVTLKQVEKMSTISPKPNEPTPEASPDDEGNEDNGEGKQDGSVESGKGEGYSIKVNLWGPNSMKDMPEKPFNHLASEMTSELLKKLDRNPLLVYSNKDEPIIITGMNNQHGRKTFDNIKIFFTRSSPRYRGKRLDVESERRLLNHNCGVDGSIEQLASDREAVLKLQPATPEYLPILIIKNNGHRQRRYKRSFNSIQRSKLGRLRRGSDIPDIKTAIYNCLKTNGLSVKFEKGTGVRLVGAKQETKVYGMVKIFLEDNLPASLVGKALVPADKEKVEQLCYNAVKDTCTTCQFICKPVRTNHLPIQVKVAVTTNEKRKKPARQLRLKRDTPDLSNIQTSIQKYVKDHPLGKLSLSGGGAIELSGRPRAKLDYSLIIIPIAIYAVIIILICLAFIFRNYLPQITTVKDVFDSPSSAPKKDDAKDDPKTKTKTKTEK